MRRFLAALAPGGVLLLGALVVQWNAASQAAVAPATPFFCFGALSVALFLSWYYGQSRPLSSGAVIALAVLAFDHPADWSTRPFTIAMLVPINFSLFALLRERGVMSFDGLVQAGIVVAQVVGMPWLSAGAGPAAGVLPGWVGESDPGARMPGSVALTFAASAVVLLVVIARRRGKVELGLFWALVAMFLALTQQAESGLWFYAGTAGLALAFGVLEHGRDLAYRDDLTGLPGRRALTGVLEQVGRPYAIAICDVDHFKRFNDQYGHEAGDQVLRLVAAKLMSAGGGGQAFRYGGEEFVILFRGRSAREAAPFADAIRRAVAESGFTPRHPSRPVVKPENAPTPAHPVAHRVTITISVGLADAGAWPTPDLVLDAADRAMYQAKEAGRNCLKVGSVT